MITIKSYGSGSKGNLYLCSTANTNIILECGVNMVVVKKLLNDNNLQFTDINAVITSHNHFDHSMSIKDLQDYNIKCYCTYDTIYKYDLSQENSIQLIDDKIYAINDIKVLSFIVNHGQTECYGFILKDKDSLKLFITDFMSMNKNLSKFKFDEIFIECNYVEKNRESQEEQENEDDELVRKYARQLNTHMELSNLVDLLNSKLFDLSNVNKINLIHISQDIGDNDLMKNTIEEEFGIECVALLPNGKEY